MARAGIVSLVAALSAACSGGTTPGAETVADSPSLRLGGQVAKGPLDGAVVRVYAADANGLRDDGEPLGETQTDSQGHWTLVVPPAGLGYLVETAGGIYVDEADPNPVAGERRRIALGPDDRFVAYVPVGNATTPVNVLTAALLEKTRRETLDQDFATVFARNRNALDEALGFDAVATIPGDPLAPLASPATDARQYAMLLGGLANAVNGRAIAGGNALPDFTSIDALIDDLSDCVLDGALDGTVLDVTVPAPAHDLNSEILRFRNNNFDAYAGVPLVQFDAQRCAEPGTSPDTVAPVFVTVPDGVTVDATGPGGTPATAPAIAGLLALVVAADNRSDGLVIVDDAPALFPLGDTVVTFTATDAAGNSALATLTVTVADLSAPVVVAPADVAVTATALLTPVDLGAPVVSDNVTAATDIVVANDAPAQGFPVGSTTVTWTATDASGLVATAVQGVTVAPTAPTATGPIAPSEAIEGAAFFLDLAAFFVDADGDALSFSITGLPAGSGLAINPATGLLSGTPTQADVEAAPLALVVSVTDGSFSVEAGFALDVANVNNAPAFTVPDTIDLAEDFDAVVSVTPVSLPVPDDELGQTVTWTLAAAPGSEPIVAFAVDTQSGKIDLSSLPDANGSVTLTLTADDGQAANAIFARDIVVDVAPVNDAPRVITPAVDLEFAVGVPVSASLGDIFDDVDGDPVTLTWQGAPASLALDPGTGVISGTPAALDVLIGLFDVVVTAADDSDAVGTDAFVVAIVDVDTDGDGLGDADEVALGTDPLDADSDDDGVGDGAEADIGGNPLVPAAAVFYVSVEGNNAASGQDWMSAWRDNAALAGLPPGASADAPTYVLFDANTMESTAGPGWALSLAPPCDHVYLLGSMKTNTGNREFAPGGAPATGFEVTGGNVISVTGCNDVRIDGVTISGADAGGIDVSGAAVGLSQVRIVGNATDGSGGGIRVVDASLTLRDSVISDNRAVGDGGGLYASGQSTTIDVDGVVASGNRAGNAGGAFAFDDASAAMRVFNTLMTGNAAASGGAIAFRSVDGVMAANVTAVFNQCLGENCGAAVSADGDTVGPSIVDSIFARNIDARHVAGSFDAGIAAANSAYNLVETTAPGIGDIDIVDSGAGFRAGYFLDQANSPAIDAGSAPAALVGLAESFTDPDRLTPGFDTATVDRGFHYRRPWPGAADGVDTVGVDTVTLNAGDPRLRVVVTPRSNGRSLGQGRQVVATVDDTSVAVLRSESRADPLGNGKSALLADVGGGEYLLIVAPGEAPGVTALKLIVDGVPVATDLRMRRCGGPVVCPGNSIPDELDR